MDNVVINITEITDSVQVNVNEAITQVFTDGVTVTGNGTISNPLVAAAGSGDMLRATYDPTNKNADAFSMENMVEGATKKILTSAERTKLNNLSGTNTGDQDLTPYLTSATAAATYQPIGAYLTTISGLNISQLTNDSGYITSAALSPYLTATAAAATYQPIGSYLTSISGLNISQLTNDSGYITSAALSPFLTTTAAAATYQPILVSGTTIKTINGTSLLGSGDITISAAAALSSITAATSSNIIHNGNFTQEWTWNSISNQSGLKLSSTANGVTTNKTQKLFESVLTGAMFHTTNTSYAGYFDNQQTGGGTYGIYARGYIAAQLEGIVNINGWLNINNLKISNNSGVTYITPSSNQDIVIGQGGLRVLFQLNGAATAFALTTKVSGTSYVYGLGCVFQSGNYLSEKTTAALIERNSDKLMFSSNSGLPGNYNTFTPTFQLTIAGATNNVGIGTTSPDVSAKLDVSSTTQGFAPPEMTATQASAISTTSRKLIIYVTDTNGTFTSAGLWMWTGATWKLILAQ
jgi:hypothetical protein